MASLTQAFAAELMPAGPLSDAARTYASEAAAANTKRAYRAAWADFVGWCAIGGHTPLPAAPEVVGSFLAARASTHKAASLTMRLVAIGQAHRLKGHRLDRQHPAIRETMKGIRRTHGTAPAKKAAADVVVLRDAVSELAKIPGPRALRDRALLLVGFAGALRRSELVALDLADIRFVAEGMVLTLRRRKTDQEGQGTEIAIPFGQSERTCPVLNLRAWLEAAGITSGPVFVSVNRGGAVGSARLSPIDVARVVKAAMEAAGADPTGFSGHSLRSGFITSAARAGVAERHIQNQSGHRSLPVLRGYIRRGSLFVDNAAAKVGL
ncbi:site-specific integrase [Belnapia sp. T18]|uniref:Site-specific integrase n=1 Tax=Belnapia arida TaxID=2804533 RepID=A0ABS1UEE7_9PROT|nr:site-specific integrase [Belnapia arida]MBL6082087.1 site-specific integrase [Belnapia arida]